MKNTKTHWLQSPNKNYLGHWDFPNGKDMILTIESAKWEEVKNPIINTSEAKRVVRFKEDVKPFICNQTNAQSILKSIGIKFMEDSAGHKIQLYVGIHKDTRTKENIDCIRIKNVPPQSQKHILNPDSPKWETAKQRVADGMTMADLTKHYQISDKDFDLLCS